jgi:hypothetical protein
LNRTQSTSSSPSTHIRTSDLIKSGVVTTTIDRLFPNSPQIWTNITTGTPPNTTTVLNWDDFKSKILAPILGQTTTTNLDGVNQEHITAFANALASYDGAKPETVTVFDTALIDISTALEWPEKENGYLSEHILNPEKPYLNAGFDAQIAAYKAAHGADVDSCPSSSVFDLGGTPEHRLTIGEMIAKEFLKKSDGEPPTYTLTAAGMANRLKNLKNEFAHGTLSLPLYKGTITSLNIPSNIGAKELNELAGRLGNITKPNGADCSFLNMGNQYHKIAAYILQQNPLPTVNKEPSTYWCFEIEVNGEKYQIRVPKVDDDAKAALLKNLQEENAGLAIWKVGSSSPNGQAYVDPNNGGGTN